MMLEFLVVFLVLAFCAPVALVVCQAGGALIDDARDGGAMCAPSRRAAITASQPQERRRIAYPVPPPYTFDTRPRLVPAQTHVSITPAPAPQRTRRAVPDLAPIAVEDWPIPAVVEPEVVPVVPLATFNHMAARFAALEIGGKR